MNCFRLGALHRVDRVRFGAFHHADFFGFGALHRGDGCGRLARFRRASVVFWTGLACLLGHVRVGGGLGVGAVDRVVWEAVCYRVELGPQRLSCVVFALGVVFASDSLSFSITGSFGGRYPTPFCRCAVREYGLTQGLSSGIHPQHRQIAREQART